MEIAWNALRQLIDPVRRRRKEPLNAGEHSCDDIARRIRVQSMRDRAIKHAHFRMLAAVSLPQKRAPRLSRNGNRIESVLNVRLRDNYWGTRKYQWPQPAPQTEKK